ncbi:hypothetical protein KUL72_26510 [Bradyrhizobium arachidis]|uniref:hypothetical protein n=1 Tax=Bradyrhizobium TaxID=374 RepID=UPI002163A27C|nr:MULTISPECIES: hypothetical protein [Bradyrhizobium]MDN4987880.1 hypothetical protein [Bradyrhizobium sp. WYCCWR 13022]UVO34993.1 hypothetical protein KUL72_26510 [Bradyrhizobium arachidis]
MDLTALEAGSPLFGQVASAPEAIAGVKTGSCPRLVRRTINGRICIQEMSVSQVFDAIVGVIIFSSIQVTN